MNRKDFIWYSTLLIPAFSCNKLEHNNSKAAGESFSNSEPFVVKNGNSRSSGFDTATGLLKVASNDTMGQFCMFESKNNNGPMPGPPLHVHKFQDEVFHILEGEFLFQVGDSKFIVQPGDIIFGPRNIPHTFYQRSKEGHMVFSYTPAGKMENIIKAISELIPDQPDKFAELCAANDVPFVGPPITDR